MKHPKHYEHAFVPEHLTQLTIETLPLEEAYFIDPDEYDTYESTPNIFVTEDRRLKMSRTSTIDLDDAVCEVPTGRIAVMRVPLIDNGTVKDAFIADLRFIENHQLFDAANAKADIQEQEDFMAYAATVENSVVFDGFIAPEVDAEIDEDIPKGTMYGNPALHPHMKRLRKRTNKVMRRFMEAEAKPRNEQETGTAKASESTADAAKVSTNLAPTFAAPGK